MVHQERVVRVGASGSRVRLHQARGLQVGIRAVKKRRREESEAAAAAAEEPELE
jgi:hypothetical protein